MIKKLLLWLKPVRIGPLSIFALFALALSGHAYIEPRSPLAFWFFQARYLQSSDKDSYLKRHQKHLELVDGGWISQGSADFLIERISSDITTEELDAILNYALIRPSAVRSFWDNSGSEKIAIKAIERLLERLPNSDCDTKIKLIEAIEVARRGRTFGKDGHMSQGSLQEAEIALNEWWETDLPWDEKRKINPFENTSIKFFEGI